MKETLQQYIGRIRGYIAGRSPMEALSAGPRQIAKLISGVLNEKLALRPAPGEWWVTEVIAHLAHTVVVRSFSQRLIPRANKTPIQDFDQDVWEKPSDYSTHKPAPSFNVNCANQELFLNIESWRALAFVGLFVAIWGGVLNDFGAAYADCETWTTTETRHVRRGDPARNDGIASIIQLKALHDSIEYYEHLALLEPCGLANEAEKIAGSLAGSFFPGEKDPAAYDTARMSLAALVQSTFNRAAVQPVSPPAFWKSRLSDIEAAIKNVKKGQVRVLAKSPGGRNIYLATYGDKQDLHSTANYNSAVAGNDPASYAHKDGTQKPRIFFLGPVHGQEVEGIAGLVNLLQVAETGHDLRGRAWPELAEKFAQCRVLIVPVANPDGRARCLYDSWVGEELDTHERVGMGTKPDGSNYVWPFVKRFHPMRGAVVGTLGAYFNDAGINLMHDEWFDPMAPETRAWFKLAREEAPDFIVSLHSHASDPSIEPTAYAPRTVKETIKQFGDQLQKRYAEAGLPHRPGGPEPEEDGVTFPPPSFNLVSALHQACGGVSFVFECPVGVKTAPYPKLTHTQILDLQLLMYEELFRFALAHPEKWVR